MASERISTDILGKTAIPSIAKGRINCSSYNDCLQNIINDKSCFQCTWKSKLFFQALKQALVSSGAIFNLQCYITSLHPSLHLSTCGDSAPIQALQTLLPWSLFISKNLYPLFPKLNVFRERRKGGLTKWCNHTIGCFLSIQPWTLHNQGICWITTTCVRSEKMEIEGSENHQIPQWIKPLSFYL